MILWFSDLLWSLQHLALEARPKALRCLVHLRACCLLSCQSLDTFLFFFLSTTVMPASSFCTAGADCGLSALPPNTLANVGDEGWGGSGDGGVGLNGPSGGQRHGSMDGRWGRGMGGFSRSRLGRSMGQWCIGVDGTFCRNTKGAAAADCSVSALPLLEIFLASVRNSSILASTYPCGLFMGTYDLSSVLFTLSVTAVGLRWYSILVWNPSSWITGSVWILVNADWCSMQTVGRTVQLLVRRSDGECSWCAMQTVGPTVRVLRLCRTNK